MEVVLKKEVDNAVEEDVLQENVEVNDKLLDVTVSVSAEAEKATSLIEANGVNSHC